MERDTFVVDWLTVWMDVRFMLCEQSWWRGLITRDCISRITPDCTSFAQNLLHALVLPCARLHVSYAWSNWIFVTVCSEFWMIIRLIKIKSFDLQAIPMWHMDRCWMVHRKSSLKVSLHTQMLADLGQLLISTMFRSCTLHPQQSEVWWALEMIMSQSTAGSHSEYWAV